jgi:hypothetical protein
MLILNKKHWQPSTAPLGITSQKTSVFIITAVRTSNLTYVRLSKWNLLQMCHLAVLVYILQHHKVADNPWSFIFWSTFRSQREKEIIVLSMCYPLNFWNQMVDFIEN